MFKFKHRWHASVSCQQSHHLISASDFKISRILVYYTLTTARRPNKLNLRFGIGLVEPHEIPNVISTAKEYRASLVDTLGDKVKNALRPGGGKTSRLITRSSRRGTGHYSRHSPVPSGMPWGKPRTACEVYQTCSSCRLDSQRCPHIATFGERLRPWIRYTEQSTAIRFWDT